MRAHRHVSIPRMHAHVHARGAPSTNRCPGSSYRAHVREHHGFSLMIFPLFPRVCVTRTPVTNLFLSPSPFASLATPLFPFLSCREYVFSSLFCLPSPIPSPASVTRYTFYTYGRRGKARESLIGKLESRGVLATDVPRRTSRGKENERGYPGGPD